MYMLSEAFIRLFVPEPDKTNSPHTRYAYGRLASFTGLGGNLLLFVIKLLAGVLSGSVSIVADAINNLSDAGSTLVTLIGFKLSDRPADREHPFGHGRMEYLSAMAVAVLIILAGFELVCSSFDKILHPVTGTTHWLSIGILVVCIPIKLWMAHFYRRIGKRISSDALIAAGIDSRNDVICTTAVLLSTLISWRTGWMIDGYTGIAVALFVMWSGFCIIKETITPLLGQKPDPKLVQDITDIVLAHEGVVGIHDVIVHDYGPGRIIASLHAEVPANQDILKSHDIIDCIEQELMQSYNILSCIHMDPVDFDNPETLRLKELTQTVLGSLDETLTLHDFRVVAGETHTNLLFDVVVPFGKTGTDTLAVRIQEALQEINPSLFAIIRIEHQYI